MATRANRGVSLPERSEWQRRNRYQRVQRRQLWLSIVVLLLFAGLPIHLVLKAHLPALVGTYWKDILSLALLPLALSTQLHSIPTRVDRATIRHLWRALTPLDKAVGLWCVIIMANTVLRLPFVWSNHSARIVLFDGAWLDLEFMPLYVAGRVLASTRMADGQTTIRRVLVLIQATGVALSLGAFAESYIIHRPLFPSVQQMAQFGDPAVYVAATHILRPYVTFDFPVGLGAYLAACLVLTLGLTKEISTRGQALWSLCVVGSCGTGLLLTHSRGPWIGAIAGLAALAVTAVITYDYRLLRAAIACIIASVIGLGLLSTLERATPLAQGTNPATSSAPVPMQTLSAAGLVAINQTASLQDKSPPDLRLLGSVPLVQRQLPPSNSTPVQRTAPNPAFLRWTIDGVTLPILFEHPPIQGNSVLQYRLHVPPHAVLIWSIALSPQVWAAWKGDGVVFTLALGEPDHANVIFQRYIDPKHNAADRHWATYQYPLALARTDITPSGDLLLDLMTNSGPRADARYDWAAWGDPHITTDAGLEKHLLLQSPNLRATNSVPISRTSLSGPAGQIDQSRPAASARSQLGLYVASILNWNHDASNQSRIAAWGASLHRWLQHPWLGSGPGSSDEIATRFSSGGSSTPLVTESQPLKELVDNGIGGLLAWILTASSLLLALRRPSRTLWDRKKHGLWAAAVTLLTISLTFQVLEVKQVAALWWFFLGIVA